MKYMVVLLFGGVLSAEIAGWADGLYWKSMNGGSDWVQQFRGPVEWADNLPNNGGFDSKTLHPPYRWGIRGGLFFQGDRFRVGLTGLRLTSTKLARVGGTFIPVLPGQIGIFLNNQFQLTIALRGAGRARLESDYARWDLHLIGRYWQTLRYQFNLLCSVSYVGLENQLRASLAGVDLAIAPLEPFTTLEQSEQMRFSGAGPVIGTGGLAYFTRYIGVSGSFQLMALYGSRRTEARSFIDFGAGVPPEVTQTFRPSHTQGLIPGMDLNLSLFIEVKAGPIRSKVVVGYQMHHYWNALEQTFGAVDRNPAIITETESVNVGYAGPIVGGQIGF